MPPFLHLQHVNVARGDNVVLHDINLTIQPGEHIAILGPNGCGKSTLIKTITCECYPLALPETKVSIFGRERWDLTELKKRLGVVSPELPGKPTLHTTGRDAVLTGFFSSSTLWPNLIVTPEMQTRADQVLELIRATDLIHKLVGQMSAGQQRRIMIGRALVGSIGLGNASSIGLGNAGSIGLNNASSIGAGKVGSLGFGNAASAGMLLLDEPSNALDLAAQRDLRNLLRELAQQGTGILLITHHIADIIPEIDRILMMQSGRIYADGPKSELLTAPNLSKLFQTKVNLAHHEGFQHAW